MKIKEEKWVAVFLEIALRAMRRVHYEYGIWGAGRQWKTGPGKSSVINMGHGVELADERAVCAAIVQEFMSSPSVTGLWQEDGQVQLRFFSVLREQPYKASGDPKHPEMVDLVVEKYECQNDKLDVYKPRSLIEAKRARLWKVDLAKGTAKPGKMQTNAVCDDINNLLRERRERTESIFIHVLVWGLYEEDSNGKPVRFADHPDEFFSKLRQKTEVSLEGPFVRWLPIRWETAPRSSVKSKRRNPLVTTSAWIALAEIDRP